MNKMMLIRRGTTITLICFLLVPLSFMGEGKSETPTQILCNSEIQQAGIFFVYAGGKSTLMGCSLDVHISPLWFQIRSSWVSYGFDGPTVIIINGIPTFYGEPVRIYMEGFKGLAPGSLYWSAKSLIGARMRIVGICTYFEIH